MATFVDQALLHVAAGDGGNGCASVHREKFKPLGGPDGGNGGRGGDVVLLVDAGVTTLLDYHRRPHRRADSGRPGQGGHRSGANGGDLVLRVPDGTVVTTPDGQLLADLVGTGTRHVVAAGGRGGLGNAALSSAARKAPGFALLGELGEGVDLVLELRYRRASWGAHTVGDEALLDLGPHLVDLTRWLTGDEVIGVRAAALSHERAELELELEHGRATLRCAADRPHRELVEARGDDGHLLARHSEGGLVAGLRGRLAGRGEPHPLVASLTTQLEAFARAARGEPEPMLATAADGHAVMAVIDAARACAAGGRPVELAVAA